MAGHRNWGGGFRPPLVAVAHGSRDPRSAATIADLAAVLRDVDPGLDVRVAFLDLSAPRLPDVLAAVHAEGHRDAVVVPLLLGSAYHARVDIPGAVAQAAGRHPRLRVRVSDVLGPDATLEAAALGRLVGAGADPDDPTLGVILAGAGSSHEPANSAVRRIAARLAQRTHWAGVVAAFASAGAPNAPAAVDLLRAKGARRIAVGSWFLAPGLLPDRVTRLTEAAVMPGPLAGHRRSGLLATDVVVAEPLGADPAVAMAVLRRYADAVEPGAAQRVS